MHSPTGNCGIKYYTGKVNPIDLSTCGDMGKDKSCMRKAYISVNAREYKEDREMEIIRDINAAKIKEGHRGLWELKYFSSSKSEDNDSEYSEGEDSKEQY